MSGEELLRFIQIFTNQIMSLAMVKIYIEKLLLAKIIPRERKVQYLSFYLGARENTKIQEC